MPRGGARSNSGPPRTPTALRVLHGNPGKRPINKGEPKPDAAKLDPPKWLGREGRVLWREYAAKLHVLGLLTELDIELFAQACALAAAARTLMPASADHIKATEAAGRILARFGFTPSDRAKLSVTPNIEDPFEQLLKKKRAT